MANTPYIDLVKPAGTDKALISVLNANSDKIDSAVGGVQDALAIVCNGNTHGAITSGQYVYVRAHDTLQEGLYTANSNIAANATLSSSNLTANSSGGLNALNEQIGNVGNSIGMIIKGISTVANNTSEKTYTISKSDFNSDVGHYLIIATDWGTGGLADVYLVTYSGGETTYCGVNKITNVIGSERVTVNRNNGTFTVIGSHACYIMRRV